jgi:hypothetical protein
MTLQRVRRRPDGLVEIVRTAPPPRRLEPQVVMFAALLGIIGLSAAGGLPIEAVGIIVGGWFAIEFLIWLDGLLDTRRPLAEVRALPVQASEPLKSQGS